MWTIEEVEDYIKELYSKYDLYLECDVLVNKRFTSTLGRVSYERDIDGNIYPSKIEFNKELLEEGTDNDIKSTIIHESCHAIAALLTGERQGHNAYFKKLCASFGLENEKATCSPEYLKKKPSNDKFKYTIHCPNCGVIGGNHRMTKNLKRIDFCLCAKCGSDGLTYTQNF